MTGCTLLHGPLRSVAPEHSTSLVATFGLAAPVIVMLDHAHGRGAVVLFALGGGSRWMVWMWIF